MPRDVNPETTSTAWEDYFEPGEKLLWQGKPIPGSTHLGYIFLSLFGMPFLGVGLFTFKEGVDHLIGSAVNLTTNFDFIFLIPFSIPFLAAGAGLVFGPWLWPYYAYKRTRYALSNKRAYVATSIWGQKMEIYAITPHSDLEIESRRYDTVTFAVRHRRDSDGDIQTDKKSFTNIEDGQKAYQILRGIQAGLSKDN